FYFAIPPDFPEELVPESTGLIVADRFGGAILRPSPRAVLHASRRKAVTLSFAKVAAERLASAIDLAAEPRGITVLPTEET
ncbi:MAG: MmcB family DNA repair protein, partial [Pseudomonadota bacterium]|nr:MmcB family DNA repair protein [Pseudomonadota bacterium]